MKRFLWHSFTVDEDQLLSIVAPSVWQVVETLLKDEKVQVFIWNSTVLDLISGRSPKFFYLLTTTSADRLQKLFPNQILLHKTNTFDYYTIQCQTDLPLHRSIVVQISLVQSGENNILKFMKGAEFSCATFRINCRNFEFLCKKKDWMDFCNRKFTTIKYSTTVFANNPDLIFYALTLSSANGLFVNELLQKNIKNGKQNIDKLRRKNLAFALSVMLEELGIYPTFKILIFYGITDWLKRQEKSPIRTAKGCADPEKEKIIFTMLYQNNFVQFKNALVRHPDSVFWTAEGENTLLHIAVMLQRHRYIGSLLAFGADIFQSNGEEESSFTLAKTAFFLQRSTASSAEKEVDNRRENIIGNFLQLAPNLQ